MRIIARSRLREFALKYTDAKNAIEAWYKIVKESKFTGFIALRKTFPSADRVNDKTIFNIKGNNYRLITYINYDCGIIFIKELLPHAEYDKGGWKQ
jgi:mRNA interferase HigB